MDHGQVVIEAFRSLGDDLEVLDAQDGFRVAFRLGIEFGERDSGLEGVFDLTAVPRCSFGLLQSPVVAFGVFGDPFDVGVKVVLLLDQSLEVHLPDLHCGFLI